MSDFVPPERMLTCGEWLGLLDDPSPELAGELKRIYRGDEGLIARRKDELRRSLSLYRDRYGDERVVIARSPGRRPS